MFQDLAPFAHLYALESSPLGFQLARDYRTGQLNGWLGHTHPLLYLAQFHVVGQSSDGAICPQSIHFPRFKLLEQTRPTAGRKAMLYLLCRQVLGKDTPNYPQQIGDCVSFGGKNASEYLTCTQILQGTRQKWEPVFPPYYYHTSRMKAGGGQIPPNEDGSLGSWLAQSVQEWGTLFSKAQGVPPYSGQVAKQWGGTRDIGQAFYQFGKEHLVKSVAQIRSWDDLVAAIVNGYPCSTASNVGYSMEAGQDGFHAQTDEWGHQMCFVGVDDNTRDPYAIILNSWGTEAHGRLKGFDDGHDLPGGVLRVRRRDAEKHIRAGETYAWSQFEGMIEQDIDRLLWKVVGS